MKLLALDTSTEACSAALLIEPGLPRRSAPRNDGWFRFELQPNQQSKLILPMIENLLSEAECCLSSLDAIAFGCGPGSFTGLRIAASVTQGIALAHDLPVIPVSSLYTMAQAAYEEFGYQKILSAIDAHVQALYYGVFAFDEHTGCMEKMGDESLVAPKDWISPEGALWHRVGTGWRYFDNLESHINYYPKANAMLTLAKKMFEQKQWVLPEEAQPAYLYEMGKPIQF